MKCFRINCHKQYFRTATIYVLIGCLLLNTPISSVLALEPDNMTSSSGVISTTWGNHTIIDTNHGAIINWSTFNTSSSQSVKFNQYLGGNLSSQSAVLNRISSGGIPTEFNGALNANGRVFIVNPAGIVFGAGSTVNVAQLVASGLNMSNDAFNFVISDTGKRMVFSGGSGEVRNMGQINANSVYLVGKKVMNAGSIVAPEGLVVMAAGNSMYLNQDGSNVVVRVDTDPMDPSADVLNEGSITAKNGSIVLAAGDRFSTAITNTGTLAASAGSITADAARIENSGTINAGSGKISLSGSEAVVLKGGSTTTANSGSIMIEVPELTIANGYTPTSPPDNTLYEKWIEARLQAGTDLELVASSSTHGNITVQNISDGEITGGSGDLALRTKYNTGGITFLPPPGGGPITTAIRTTNGGSVYMLAGEGGITIGNVSTEVPSNDKVTEPGKIRLFTNNYGAIETGRLTVKGGSYDEVSIIACGNLTIRGNVETITNQVPSQIKEVGQARTCLVSVHGDVDIQGAVIVNAHGKNFSTADVHICAGANVRIALRPGQQIDASAHTSENGPAQASVAIHAGKYIEGPGVISIIGGGSRPVHVYAKAGGGSGTAEVYSSDDPSTWDKTNGNAHAVLEINLDRTLPCPDCPMPPDMPPPIPPISLPDEATIHMGALLLGNVLENDAPPQGKTLTVILVDEPKYGQLIDFDWETGDYKYQSQFGYVGTDSFTYIATDGEFYTEPITVTITMTNTAPFALGELPETHMGISITGTLQDNVDDPDGDPLTILLVDGPTQGILTLNPDGSYNYKPQAGYVGEDSFTYSVTDGEMGAHPVQATVTIKMTNTPPVLVADAVSTNQGVPILIDVLANDSDPDDDLFWINSFVYEGKGILVLNHDGTFNYTPLGDFTGQDSFTYYVSDGELGAELSWSTVNIIVNPIEGPLLPPPPPPIPPVPPLPWPEPVLPNIPAAPLPERIELEYSGCPALIKWTALELGISERTMQIWIVNALASNRDMLPCDACAKLKQAATILEDTDGTRIAALAQVVNELASSTAPPTEEQMASITDAIGNKTAFGQHYAAAGEYIDALALYVETLSNKMNFTTGQSVQLAAEKYISRLVENENPSVTGYLAARLSILAQQ